MMMDIFIHSIVIILGKKYQLNTGMVRIKFYQDETPLNDLMHIFFAVSRNNFVF